MAIKTDTSQQFYAKIHRIAQKKRFPLRVMFELTYRCNFNCLYCYVPKSFRRESERKDLKTKEIYHILDQLREAGCLYLGFTGGEPFAREDILDILRYAKAKGFEIMIYTNASLIDKKIADELKQLRPNKVDITINSLKKERFERITRTPGSYERVFRAIELLHKRNIPLGFKSCVLKYNEDEIRNISKFSKSHNGLYRLDTMLMPRLDGSGQPYRYRGRLKTEKSPPFENDEADFPQETKSEQKKSRLFNCGVGLYNLVINPFGELKMCIHINYPRYNILEASLKDCWQRLKGLVDGIKADENYECDECQLRFYCRWCPARSWLGDGRFTSCVPESKRMAEYNRRMAQGEKIPVKLIENHDQAYYFWKKLGISNKPLIHFDAHIDFNFHPVKPLRQTLEEAKSKQDLLRQLSQNLAYKQLNIKEDSLTNIGNYIYPAMRDGIVSDFYWVIPGKRQEFKSSLKNLRHILKSFFYQDPFKTGRIAKENSMLKAEIYGRNFIITTLDGLPANITDAIVDIDCDFFTTETIRRTKAAQDIDRKFPWVWPEAFVDRLKNKKLRPSCITIAYSVNGGFTPLIYKFLGDETALFFNGISQSLKKIISIKDEALASFKKGKIKESVDMLKGALQNLDVVRISCGLKNRLKAHIAFVLFRCFVALNNLAKARRYYNLAVSSDRTYRVKDNNYGPLYLRRKGCLKKAEREFNIILSAGEADSYALSGLADIFMRRKDFAKAKALFKKAYRLDRKNQEALLGLGRTELLLKNYKTALRYLKNSKSKNRMQAVTYSLLAEAYEGLGKFDEALKEYRLALFFGIDLNLYLKFSRLLKKTGIPEKHKEWIEGRINTYKNYKKSFFELEKSSARARVLGKGRKNRKKRLISCIDSILYELDAI